MSQGCKKINKKMLIPSHQKNRLSVVDMPISTHQATNVVTDSATDKA